MRRHLLVLVFSFVFSGCASAWVVRQTADGGTIGYRNFTDSEKAHVAIEKLIQCPNNYQTVEDAMRSSAYTYTVNQPVTVNGTSNGTVTNAWTGNTYNTQTNSQYTAYVPTTQQGVSYWREYTYRCGNSSSASLESYRTPASTASCPDNCNNMAASGSLQRGMTAQQCINIMCK